VDVGVPTLARADQLAAALDGLVTQTHTSWRATVSDNASEDDTPGVVGRIGDSRISVSSLATRVSREVNYGRALRAGSAPYVAILADDDTWFPSFLSRCVTLMEADPSIVVVHTGYETFDADAATIARVDNPLPGEASVIPGRHYIELLVSGQHQIQFAATLLRRSALPSQGFTPEDGVADDLGLLLRTARRGRVAVVAQPLVRVRVHDDSESGRASAGIPNGHYLFTPEWRRQFRDTKIRFISETIPGRREAWRLRRIAMRSYRRQLLVPAGLRLRHQGPWAALRAFLDGVAEDPAAVVDPRAWKWAAAAYLRG
jgi:glycosyltransferase involved in cell wall biosynthesis